MNANYIVACVNGSGCGNCAVYATAHRDQNLHRKILPLGVETSLEGLRMNFLKNFEELIDFCSGGVAPKGNS